MKLNQSKEWYRKSASLEGDSEVGAGSQQHMVGCRVCNSPTEPENLTHLKSTSSGAASNACGSQQPENMTKSKTKRTAKRTSRYAPSKCSEAQLCRISRDNFETKDFSIMTDSYTVWLSEQKMGEQQKQHIGMPRPIFNKLIRWYLRSQVAVRS